jgi:hypothetical protein
LGTRGGIILVLALQLFLRIVWGSGKVGKAFLRQAFEPPRLGEKDRPQSLAYFSLTDYARERGNGIRPASYADIGMLAPGIYICRDDAASVIRGENNRF